MGEGQMGQGDRETKIETCACVSITRRRKVAILKVAGDTEIFVLANRVNWKVSVYERLHRSVFTAIRIQECLGS